MQVNYRPSPTLTKFHQCRSKYRCIIGPIGSGKSVGCLMDLYMQAVMQPVNSSGIRKSRSLVVRNTFDALKMTTIKTAQEWWPFDVATWRLTDKDFHLKGRLPDKSFLDWQVWFRALDSADDVKKVLSLEITNFFMNEGKELRREIFDGLTGRIGRWPKPTDEEYPQDKPHSFGIIDTNPCDEDHWIHELFVQQEHKENYTLYQQPSGLATNAENIENLKDNYYEEVALGKSKAWVKVYVEGKFGKVEVGTPVFKNSFDEQTHVIPSIDAAIDKSTDPKGNPTIFIGIDFGVSPGVVFAQLDKQKKQLTIQAEITGEGMTLGEVCVQIKDILIATYELSAKNFKQEIKNRVQLYGDPAGNQRTAITKGLEDLTSFKLLRDEGYNVKPAPTNEIDMRIESVASSLEKPGYIRISDRCDKLINALAYGYVYEARSYKNAEFRTVPTKNYASHIADALEYLVSSVRRFHTVEKRPVKFKRDEFLY